LGKRSLAITVTKQDTKFFSEQFEGVKNVHKEP